MKTSVLFQPHSCRNEIAESAIQESGAPDASRFTSSSGGEKVSGRETGNESPTWPGRKSHKAQAGRRCSADFQSAVSQVCNLQGAPPGIGPLVSPSADGQVLIPRGAAVPPRACRLKIGDTAECNSVLPVRPGTTRRQWNAGDSCEVSETSGPSSHSLSFAPARFGGEDQSLSLGPASFVELLSKPEQCSGGLATAALEFGKSPHL
jgi:hypothetical protein